MAVDEQEHFCVDQYPRLVGTLTLYTGDPCLAEELAQESLARALARWDRVQGAAVPGAYVHRIAMNMANSHFRRRRAAARALTRHGPGQSHHDPDGADAVAVREAIASLPRRQRQIVVLRFHSQLTLREVAETLGMTEGAAKALNHRATQTLRNLLTDEEHADVR